jgi:hypothetical protein
MEKIKLFWRLVLEQNPVNREHFLSKGFSDQGSSAHLWFVEHPAVVLDMDDVHGMKPCALHTQEAWFLDLADRYTN